MPLTRFSLDSGNSISYSISLNRVSVLVSTMPVFLSLSAQNFTGKLPNFLVQCLIKFSLHMGCCLPWRGAHPPSSLTLRPPPLPPASLRHHFFRKLAAHLIGTAVSTCILDFQLHCNFCRGNGRFSESRDKHLGFLFSEATLWFLALHLVSGRWHECELSLCAGGGDAGHSKLPAGLGEIGSAQCSQHFHFKMLCAVGGEPGRGCQRWARTLHSHCGRRPGLVLINSRLCNCITTLGFWSCSSES